jgi:predicted RNase H-like HicB family nuclease
MTRESSAVVQREGDAFVAQRLDVDVASHGASEHEALATLQEALELYVQSPQATDAPHVSKVRVDIDAA